MMLLPVLPSLAVLGAMAISMRPSLFARPTLTSSKLTVLLPPHVPAAQANTSPNRAEVVPAGAVTVPVTSCHAPSLSGADVETTALPFAVVQAPSVKKKPAIEMLLRAGLLVRYQNETSYLAAANPLTQSPTACPGLVES